MRIIVAGAGAGKTTSMAEKVLNRFKEIEDNKIVYVITYTNAARDEIRNKIIDLNKYIPKHILVETIHSFLLNQIIFPYYHLIYDQCYTGVSNIILPSNPAHKKIKLNELKKQGIIHVDEVTQVAKWIICGKSNESKGNINKHNVVINIIKRYLDMLFIDEAQDMDKYLKEIIEVLNKNNMNLYLVGDPKQDLRGRNQFKKLINNYHEMIEYRTENYRCPVSHVKFANQFVCEKEKQVPQKVEMGEIKLIFENDIDIKKYISSSEYDYVYIYRKNNRFNTHNDDLKKGYKNLTYELKTTLLKTHIEENQVEKCVYILSKNILKVINNRTNSQILNRLKEILGIELNKNEWAKLSGALDASRLRSENNDSIMVNTIDRVKGLEGKNCIFIVTEDIVPYLLKKKSEDNKMKNYLYVALTRSKSRLELFITKEVEEKYGRDEINKLLNCAMSNV